MMPRRGSLGGAAEVVRAAVTEDSAVTSAIRHAKRGMLAGKFGSSLNVMPETRPHIVREKIYGTSMHELIKVMKKDAAAQGNLIGIVAVTLECTVQQMDHEQRRTDLTAFEGNTLAYSATEYLERIVKYSGASPCCVMVGLVYLERLKEREQTVFLTSKTLQRFLLVAIMVAAKFLEDDCLPNKSWAEIGGISTSELNVLELDFLFAIGFDLSIRREEYDWHAEQLLLAAMVHNDPECASACAAGAAAAAMAAEGTVEEVEFLLVEDQAVQHNRFHRHAAPAAAPQQTAWRQETQRIAWTVNDPRFRASRGPSGGGGGGGGGGRSKLLHYTGGLRRGTSAVAVG